jgi:hypothetical protein
MGTAISPEGRRTGQDLLQKLYSRAQLAYRELGNLIDGQKKYFYRTSEAIIDAFDLPADKADMLRDFTKTLASLLDRAYLQAEAKLQKLQKALESNNVKVELASRAKKTLHITPEGEEWHVRAHMVGDKRWLFSLPICKVSAEAEFPDILGLNSEALYYLQAGWRASDESYKQNKPRMFTTQPWQIFAWVAVRHGLQQIYLESLNLNMTKPTISWGIATKSWEQQWPAREGKKLAQQVASQHPLGMLAWYLGDGKRHKHDLKYKVGNSDEYKSKSIIADIVKDAYRTRYGTLLDLLESDKWATLKNLYPKQNPVHAELAGYTFLLSWFGKVRVSIEFKNEREARECVEILRQHGITQIRTTLSHKKYVRVYFTTHEVLKLAEKYPQWRRALKELAQKYNVQPRGPLMRRLLELAENPPFRIKI